MKKRANYSGRCCCLPRTERASTLYVPESVQKAANSSTSILRGLQRVSSGGWENKPECHEGGVQASAIGGKRMVGCSSPKPGPHARMHAIFESRRGEPASGPSSKEGYARSADSYRRAIFPGQIRQGRVRRRNEIEFRAAGLQGRDPAWGICGKKCRDSDLTFLAFA